MKWKAAGVSIYSPSFQHLEGLASWVGLHEWLHGGARQTIKAGQSALLSRLSNERKDLVVLGLRVHLRSCCNSDRSGAKIVRACTGFACTNCLATSKSTRMRLLAHRVKDIAYASLSSSGKAEVEAGPANASRIMTAKIEAVASAAYGQHPRDCQTWI
jgi:hypothetical protein